MFRSLIVCLVLLAALPLAAAAQAVAVPSPAAAPAAAPPAPAGPPPAGAHRHRSAYMAALRGLNLSEVQRQQIVGFVRDTRTANAGADQPTRRANGKKLRAEIDGVLTADQRSQLRATLAQRRMASPAP